MVAEKLTVGTVDRVSAYHVNKLVAAASAFESTVVYEMDRKKANGKSIIGLISLQLKRGMAVTVSCEGRDEKEALGSISEAFANLK